MHNVNHKSGETAETQQNKNHFQVTLSRVSFISQGDILLFLGQPALELAHEGLNASQAEMPAGKQRKLRAQFGKG